MLSATLTNKKLLFETKYSLDDFERTPIRPLNELSSFLVEKVPKIISDNEFDKLSEIEILSNKILNTNCINSLDSKEIDIARLDTQFLKSAMVHSDQKLGESFTKLYQIFSSKTQQPNILTYQDCVRNNPFEDIRTFSSGSVGFSEASFYAMHELMERMFESQNTKIFEAIELALKDEISVKKLQETVNEQKESFSSLLKMMGSFRKMDTGHFVEFREYLKGYEGLPGPSGVFSPGVVITDYLICGQNISPEFYKSVEDTVNEGFYPNKDSIIKAQEYSNNKKSLYDIAIAINNDELTRSVGDFIHNMWKLRKVHFGSVRKHIPEVAQNQASGTSLVENSGLYLQTKIQAYTEIKKGFSR